MMARLLVEFTNVGYTYPAPARGRPRTAALADLSFTIEPEEILGVVGPNRGGKTTMVRLVTRVISPDTGRILIDGAPIERLAPVELARRIAVVPQDLPPTFPFTVGELALMGRYPHRPGRVFENAEDLAIARDAMAATGVLDLAAVPLANLSGGERQRAVLARALAQRPQLLVLDEPTAHLDLRYQAACADLLRRLNGQRAVTIVCVSHDVNLVAEISDRVLLLAAGRLVRIGPPAEVLEERVLQAVYGCPLTVEKSATGRPHVTLAWTASRGGETKA
jgi:iron complex transport system ATP-binding protein